MAQKHLENLYPADINVNLMEKNAVQIEIGIAINVDVSGKTHENIIVQKIIFLFVDNVDNKIKLYYD